MNDAEIRMQVKADDGGGFVKLGSNIKQCNRQAEFLKIKIDDLKIGIQQMESTPKEFGKIQIAQAKAELEKMENQYTKLGVTGEASTTKMSKGFGNLTKYASRFVFNMFAVGSVFALVARAGRSYMETNEDARATMEITSNVIGQMLAPAMKALINLTQYAIIGIAELIRLFTGYDALAKVTTKNIKKASDATKEFKKQLAGFDEINNLGEATNLTAGLKADLQALDDFQTKVKEVRGWLEKNRESIMLVGTALLSVFGAIALSKVIGGIASLIGVSGAGATAGTGLAGMTGLLKYMLGIGAIVIGVNFLYGALTGRDLVSDLKLINDEVQRQGGWLKLAGEWWGNFFKDTFKGLEGWYFKLKDILKLVNTINSSGAGLGGGFSGSSPLPGFSGGGGRFANGGEPPLNKVSLVGEKGPELFVPYQRGTIVPNNELKSFESGGNYQDSRPINIVLKVNERIFGEISATSINKLAEERGEVVIRT